MVKRLHVTDLAIPCITRARGEEAFRAAKAHLDKHGSVEIDLGGIDLLSSSFLDGLINGLALCGLISNVTFAVDDAEIRAKLARIAGLRKVTLFTSSGQKRVAVTPIVSGNPNFQVRHAPPSSLGVGNLLH
jgi:hypothetical protein